MYKKRWEQRSRAGYPIVTNIPIFNFSQKGFTLIELMIVIAIIGILAAIAIPSFITYRERGYDAMAKADAKNAYDSARAYFTDYPNKTLSNMAEITAFGYIQSDGVSLGVSGNATTLSLSASHASGSKIFTVNENGQIWF